MAKTTKTTKPAAGEPTDTTETNPPAAPAAPETAPEQAEAPAVQADAAAPPPGAEGSAPPASADAVPPAPADEKPAPPADDSTPPAPDAPPTVDPALSDQSQETLDKQAEVKQPEAPLLDRVLHRLATSMRDPFGEKYATPSPTTRLHGEAIELNTRLYEAMVAEGVKAHGQGDTLQFLLEQLGETLKSAF